MPNQNGKKQAVVPVKGGGKKAVAAKPAKQPVVKKGGKVRGMFLIYLLGKTYQKNFLAPYSMKQKNIKS
jgi:hypothetical protein